MHAYMYVYIFGVKMGIAAFYYDYYDSQLANGEKLQIIVLRAALNSSDEPVGETDRRTGRQPLAISRTINGPISSSYSSIAISNSNRSSSRSRSRRCLSGCNGSRSTAIPNSFNGQPFGSYTPRKCG